MWRRWGIRSRIISVALAVVTVLLVLWGLAFLYVLREALTTTARQSARATAVSVADGLAESAPKDLVPSHKPQVGERIIQVVAADGRVLAWNQPAGQGRPLAEPTTTTARLDVSGPVQLGGYDEGDSFVIARTRAQGPSGQTYAVIVAEPLHIEEGDALRLAGIVVAASLVLFGILVWVIRYALGAALSPVERMRGQVEGITTTSGLGTTVEVPPGGDELTRLGRTLNAMLGRLDAADRSLRSFVSDAGHELRGPLSTMQVSIDRLSRELPAEERHDIARRAEREVSRLGALVSDLLLLATADEKGIELHEEEMDLDDLVLLESRSLRDRGTLVELDLHPARISGDRLRLGRAVRNLLDNAERHRRHTVRAAVTDDGERCTVSIDNDGPTIPADEREQVFDRFVRLDTARDRESGGTGLGLAIVAEIVKAHRGAVRATESDDGWCRFEIALPAASGDGQPMTGPDRTGPTAGAARRPERPDGRSGPTAARPATRPPG